MISFASAMRSDVLRQLVAHWRRMRGSRRMPTPADFDPLDVRFALGYVSLIEVHRDPLRFYFRLDGTSRSICSASIAPAAIWTKPCQETMRRWPPPPIPKSWTMASRATTSARSPSAIG